VSWKTCNSILITDSCTLCFRILWEAFDGTFCRGWKVRVCQGQKVQELVGVVVVLAQSKCQLLMTICVWMCWNNQEVESICDDWNCVKQRQSMRYECTLLSWFVRLSRASHGAWTWLCCHHHMVSPCMPCDGDCHKSSPASKQVMNDLMSTTWACVCLVLTKSLITCLLTGLELWNFFLWCRVPVHPLLVRTPYPYSCVMPASVCWCRWVTFSSVLWEQLNFNRVNKTFTNWSLIIANDQKVQVAWLVLFG